MKISSLKVEISNRNVKVFRVCLSFQQQNAFKSIHLKYTLTQPVFACTTDIFYAYRPIRGIF